ncbi:MAG: cytochrome c biogenesis heme-transporting ATPase CcmA [Gammaproteobacteria bacterium]
MMLTVQNLSCERDDRVLFEALNFTVQEHDILQVEGPNGSGKTTLLRILCGLNSHYSGHIFWQGEELANIREQYCHNLLYVGHHAGVKAALTPEENLRWLKALQPQALGKGDIEEALAKVGLYGYEDVPCYMLSAGQQRRVGLARLYMSTAKLWILDEPFTALDKKGVGEKEKLIAAHAERGGAVILTTHHDLTIKGRPVRSVHLTEAVQ